MAYLKTLKTEIYLSYLSTGSYVLRAVAAGQLSFPVNRVYHGLEQVPQAHDDMEHNRATGKLVVRVRH
jgi:NADPH-dependent curcumin reductase CurA